MMDIPGLETLPVLPVSVEADDDILAAFKAVAYVFAADIVDLRP